MAALAAAELLIAWDWPRAAPWTASDLIPPVLTIAGFALLPRRHQRPIEVFAAVVLLSLAGSAIPLHHPFAVILMALYAVAANRPRRPAIVALVTTWALFLLSYLLYPIPDHPVRVRLTSALASCLVAGILWALALRFGQQARALAEHDRRRTAAIAQAVAAERLRLARELHDIVSHTVSIMVLQAAGARRVLHRDPARAEEALGVVEDLGHEAMEELRRLLTVLRTPGEHDQDGDPRAPGLDELAALLERTSAAGVHTVLEVTGTPGRLAPSVELTAFRVVQEALTNTVKHVGPGTMARVRLAWRTDRSPRRLEVQVIDEGPPAEPPGGPGESPMKGTDNGSDSRSDRRSPTRCAAGGPLSNSLGLVGLSERVTAVGGRFETGRSGTGFRVLASLPASPAPATPQISLTEADPVGTRRSDGAR